MLQTMNPFILRPISRLVRASLKPFKSKQTDKSKYDWEFEWQKREWLDLWKTPEVKAKCLEYWRSFRHLDDITRIVHFDDNSAVLDVGCGLSSVLHYLPGKRVGVDPLGDRYKAIYEYPFEVVRSTGEQLPFASEAFDVAFSSNCIDHTSNPNEVLGQIKRVLKTSGHFVLTCEVFAEDIGTRNPGHPHSMTYRHLRELVTRHFRIIAEWNEPWYGMRGFCVGDPPTAQRECIFILTKPLGPPFK